MIYKYFIRIILLNLIVTPLTTISQDVGIGEWRDHLPYNYTISVTAGNNNIYCATPYSLFYYNINDNSVNRFTRVSGLSDIGISRIGFNEVNDVVLVAYNNTNLDLINGGQVINMPDIINSNAITPEEKTITNILFIDNIAYLSCGFGIVVLNITSQEIMDTYYIGPNGSHLKVFDLTYNDTSFFAATESGIYSAYIDNPNLAYFEAWTKDTSLLFPDESYNHITYVANKIFINKQSSNWAADTILYFSNNQWNYGEEIFSNDKVYGLKPIENSLFVVQRYSVKGYDEDLTKVVNIRDYNNISPRPRDITKYSNKFWIADTRFGLVRRINSTDNTFIHPDGPTTSKVYDLASQGDIVWSVAGGKDLSWAQLGNESNASSFHNNEWLSITNADEPAFDTIHDLVSVTIDPFDISHVFSGSWNGGLVEFKNNKVAEVYDKNNSSLDFIQPYGYYRIGGLAFDGSGNLWVTNSSVADVLSVRQRDGNWKSFSLGGASSEILVGELITNSYGQKWILTNKHQIFVFNENGTINNDSDDDIKMLTSSSGNGNIPGTKVFSIAEDKDREIWIGTDQGVAVFYSPENVFTNYNFDAQQILIPRNDGTNQADILLENEAITAIAIDGANNKWIGTDRSGIYHLSPDGQIEIHHFTEQNSPLFSNNITSIAINNVSGEVFFGTAKGIISYKSTATEGGETNDDVYAFPNPVRPGYNGAIAINGLVKDANFKITDVSGNLIYAGRAEGGRAIWDGKNFDGRKAQTGVYLVFATNDDGSEKIVTKILFVN